MSVTKWPWNRASLDKVKEVGGKIRLAHAKRKAIASGETWALLDDLLKEYLRRYDEAEWEDNWHEMKYLDGLISDVRHRIRLGEKYDMPF